MKKTLRTLAAATVGVLLALPAFAGSAEQGSMKGMDHGSMKGMGMKDHGQHAAEWGPAVRQTTVEGHTITYHLLDNRAAMAKMGDMKGHDMSQMKSHHLMVFVAGPDGKLLEDAKVGYRVEGPAGEQKTMAMAMKGGYGADVELGPKGSYEIVLKVLVGDRSLIDEFQHEMK